MKDRIRSAFGEIHADEALIDSTAAYLRGALRHQRRTGGILAFRGVAGTFAALAVLAVAILAYAFYFTADAHVSIDVNPSVELALNRFDRVVGAYAYNADGERILNGADLRGKPFDEAAELILTAVRDEGYLTEDAFVSVTVQAASSDKEHILCSALLRLVEERILSVQPAAGVEVFPVTAEIRDIAHGHHMSPAKYLAILELMEVDEDATLEAYGDSTIGQIRQRAWECGGMHDAVSDSGDHASGSWGGHGHSIGGSDGHRGHMGR